MAAFSIDPIYGVETYLFLSDSSFHRPKLFLSPPPLFSVSFVPGFLLNSPPPFCFLESKAAGGPDRGQEVQGKPADVGQGWAGLGNGLAGFVGVRHGLGRQMRLIRWGISKKMRGEMESDRREGMRKAGIDIYNNCLSSSSGLEKASRSLKVLALTLSQIRLVAFSPPPRFRREVTWVLA